jgi:hypothetical protein
MKQTILETGIAWIILKWISEKQSVKVQAEFSWLRIVSIGGHL